MPRLRVKFERARLPLLLLSGSLLSLAFPAPDVAPLAWVALVPLLLLTREERLGRALVEGIVFGVGFFGALLIWISLVGWVAWIVLVLLQALFIGVFALGYAWATRERGTGWTLLAAPALWVAIEYVRSLVPVGGFTWGELAQSQHDLTWLLRPASLAGGWLVAFLVVGVNALIAFAVEQIRDREALRALLAVGAVVLVLLLPFALPANDATGASSRVAIVQGNVPREWDRSFFEKNLVILKSHAQLTAKLDTSNLDFIVWPESSIGIDPESSSEVTQVLEDAAEGAGVPIIAGGNSDAGEDHYKVMAFHLSREGTIVDRYQKTHLVPFGEYVPARDLLGWIPMLDQVPRDAIPADEPTLFETGGRIAPVLSFEGDFGSLVRERIGVGGRLLLVMTNTSTWGDSSASAQHLAFSQVRAAETGVWVVHAAISGISAFVAPDGSVIQATDLWTAATLVQDLRFAEDASFYARAGDWFPIGCLIASGVPIALPRRRRAGDPPQ